MPEDQKIGVFKMTGGLFLDMGVEINAAIPNSIRERLPCLVRDGGYFSSP